MTRLLLADDNFPLPVVNSIIAAGHDVLVLAAFSPGISDRAVLALAREQGRCLLTFDSDFGDLIFFQGAPRVRRARRHDGGQVLVAAWQCCVV